jgi:hypothetical protein
MSKMAVGHLTVLPVVRICYEPRCEYVNADCCISQFVHYVCSATREEHVIGEQYVHFVVTSTCLAISVMERHLAPLISYILLSIRLLQLFH